MVARRRSGVEPHKPFESTSMDMSFPNSDCIDGHLTTDSDRRHQPLLPPPENPVPHHQQLHQIQSSSADISCHNFPPRPSVDLTAPVPDDDAGEWEWLLQFVEGCSHDDFMTVGEKIMLDSSVQRSNASFTRSKADLRIRRRSRAASRRWRLKAALHGGSYGAGKGLRVPRCSRCASRETPQLQRGPLGPKTRCNVCGVRYHLGQFLPEYRPASSSTFMLSQNSNSHQKVLELQRQEELNLTTIATGLLKLHLK